MSKNNDITMGERIRRLRLQKGYTQEELGKFIGVSRASINKIENGTTENIKRGQIEILANVLGTNPVYLMGWSEQQNIVIDEIENQLHKVFKDVLINNNIVNNENNEIYSLLDPITTKKELYYGNKKLDEKMKNYIQISIQLLLEHLNKIYGDD